MTRFLWAHRLLGLAFIVSIVATATVALTPAGTRTAHGGVSLECVDLVQVERQGIACISLDPKTGSNTSGETTTVTATIGTFDGPVQGIDLYIFVIKGPNAGERIRGFTDAEGKLALTYTGDGGVGTDLLGTEACIVECGFGADDFMDGCVANPDPCVETFFNNPTCGGAEADQYICNFAEQAWVEPAPAATTPSSSGDGQDGPVDPVAETDDDGSGFPWWLLLLLIAVAGGLVLFFVWARRRRPAR